MDLKTELTKDEYTDDDCKEHQEDAECGGQCQSRMIRARQASYNRTQTHKTNMYM